MLGWSQQFSICCFLDNNDYPQQYHNYDCLLAVNAVQQFTPADIMAKDPFVALKEFISRHKDWLFGHFNYEFAGIETGATILPDKFAANTTFPSCFLFQPETVIELTGTELKISCLHSRPSDIYTHIATFAGAGEENTDTKTGITPVPVFSREEYIHTVEKLRQHIQRGDCYEINFCQQFYASDTEIDPVNLYRKLSGLSPTPFAAFYKLDDQYAICASPERYVCKTGDTIISQPIKGTAARAPHHAEQDQHLKESLLASAKDKSENVMVVDLVRNDLSKICTEGSVHVEELFGIYSFPQVHQMISTIKGRLLPEMDLSDVLQASFPMGSMTGAPKKRVMELTAEYERSKRELYSGTIGYVTPEGDFDFNVVIRSIFYNSASKYLHYLVGGGITFYSDAANEYEECLLKAKAIERALQ